MRKNVGTADRIVRSLIAVVFVGLLVSHTIVGSRLVFFGWALVAVLVITVLDETCPLYLLLGASTRSARVPDASVPRKDETISTQEK